MPLSTNISAEALLAKIQAPTELSKGFTPTAIHAEEGLAAKFADCSIEPLPKFRLRDQGLDSDVAYKMIKDELNLDGTPALNLASFVNTYVEPNALKLSEENITKNLADSDEYPALLALHQRCISMISHLWNVPDDSTSVGTATTGSSEAIHLGGLAMKRRWEERRKAAGKSYSHPNIIMGSNSQVALEKFARYFEVEARILDVDASTGYGFNPDILKKNVDENTIGVFAILGSTYTGHYQDVEAISKVLDEYEQETGVDIPIHVDGASGGFVAPFVQPNFVWDFRLDRVVSINTSGHKFGLTTAGCGWVIWRDRSFLPDSLVFVLKYLGGSEETFTLNFSRPGFPVIHQYYNLVSYGFQGFHDLHGASLMNARLLCKFLESSDYFDVVSDIHRLKSNPKGQASPHEIVSSHHERFIDGLPVVAFKFSNKFKSEYPEIPQEAVSSFLRMKGYIIPNYPLPTPYEDQQVLRVVVRASHSVDLLDKLMTDIVKVVQRLIASVQEFRDPNTQQSDRSVQLYKLLAKAVEADSSEIEHEKQWAIDDKSKTRSTHVTTC